MDGEAAYMLTASRAPLTAPITTTYTFQAPSLTYPAQPTGGTDSLVAIDATSFRWSSLRVRNTPVPYGVYRFVAIFHR
jgi:hypothetical protein